MYFKRVGGVTGAGAGARAVLYEDQRPPLLVKQLSHGCRQTES